TATSRVNGVTRQGHLVLALTPQPPLPTTGRGETESGRLSAPPRPAFGREGWGVRAGSQGDKNAPPVCRQSDGVRNSDRKTGWIPPSPSAVRGRERAHNAMSRSLLIPRSRAAAAARGGRAPGQRPRRGGKPATGRASGRPAAS